MDQRVGKPLVDSHCLLNCVSY